MARFSYRMQSILNIKLQLETQAKMEFGQAQARLNDEEDKLQAMRDRRSAFMDEGRRLRESGLDVLRIKENEQSVKIIDEMIEGQLEIIRRARQQVENARNKLTLAMQERQAQERLREHAFEEFLEEEKHNEAKEIDELVTFRHGTGAE